MIDVRAVCAEYDLEIVPANVLPQPGQTRAVATMERILNKYGEGHFRMVLTTLAETRDNNCLIDETSLYATSDLILACPDWVENHTSEWLEWWDKIPLGPIMATISQLRGKVHARFALAGAIYLMLTHYSNQRMAKLDSAPSIKSKLPKQYKGKHLRQVERIRLGRKLIQIKADLPRGHFIPWVKDESGISYGAVQRYMREAKAA
ncbi:hypothetical protein HB779_02035 [Phyllobacterium sp. 628]|uniref:hypothetical protein n=1 Tax=Phyllobacterium sp. 628 TaxID=2718938 RepID=UPI0016621EB5|nr:hypothetical protein [Phyllobacterium sp. 628]QND50801.1 hypothetical protein HB779_02035 [Phyllobacterium sp. 628]